MARRNTRELILNTSLALFNAEGEHQVTTNQIADEADISPGNLYYHFHSKNDIVLELFKQFLGRIQPLLEIPEDVVLDTEDLWFHLHLLFEAKGDFRFFYRNLSDITARMDNLRKAFHGLLVMERKTTEELLKALIRRGVMEADEGELAALNDQILLLLTYWISFADIFDPNGVNDGSAQSRAVARILQLVSPYIRQPERQHIRLLADTHL